MQHISTTVRLNRSVLQFDDAAQARLEKYLAESASLLDGDPDPQEILSDLEQAVADQCTRRLRPNQTGGQRSDRKSWYSLSALPDFYFDYNRYETENDARNTVYDRLNLRAEARSKYIEYFGEYLYQKNNFEAASSQTHLLEFQANFRRYWKESATRLESYNTLFFEKRDTEKTVSFFDHTSFIKNLGPDLRDSFAVDGGVRYLSPDGRREYGLNLDAGYNKFFSDRF